MADSEQSSGCAPALAGLLAFVTLLIGILIGLGSLTAFLHLSDDGLQRLNLAPDVDTDHASAPAEPIPLALPILETLRVHRSLDASDISAHLRDHRDLFHQCYAPALEETPSLGGEVDLQFSISGSSGDVQAAVIRDSTLQSESVESCITDTIRQQWSFDAPEISGVAEVRFDILFVPVAASAP